MKFGEKEKKKWCNKPSMEFFRKSAYPFGGNTAPKRDLSRESLKLTNETLLIASRSTQHSARELCESDTSRGPDFISHHEGLHCNMTTREFKPLCDGSNVEDCFAWEPQSRVVGKRNVAQVLDYGRFEEWD